MDHTEKPLESSLDASVASASVTEPSSSPAAARTRRTIYLFLLAASLALVGMGTTAYVYARPLTDSNVRRITSVIPYPAVVVNHQAVSIHDFLAERDALANYFSVTGATDLMPSEEDLQRQIMDTLVNKTAMQQIARAHKITLDPVRVETFYQQTVEQSGGEQPFSEQLAQTFGWTTDEFKARVVQSVVLAMQVGEWVSQDAEVQADARALADAALARLESGEEFSVVATETSQDLSSAQGGDIGYVPVSELPPEWADQVTSLEVGGHSGVIDTEGSYLIFHLNERIESEEDDQLGLSLIIITKKTVDDVVSDYVDQAKVWRFVAKNA